MKDLTTEQKQKLFAAGVYARLSGGNSVDIDDDTLIDAKEDNDVRYE